MKNRCDILNLEWVSRGRDIDIVEPVLCYLEDKCNYHVVRDSIWLGELKLLKYRPKLFIISNSTGAGNNVRMIKFAHKLRIKTVSLVSEGDFIDKKETAEVMFWGWNFERKCYEDLTLFWSERAKQIVNKHIDNNEFNIKVSGATGFDRYHYLRYMTKDGLLKKYDKPNYKHVVGISVYPFDYYDENTLQLTKDGTFVAGNQVENAKFFINSKLELNKIYRQVIENNSDIAFILKLHPAIEKEDLTDCAGLYEHRNVIKIKTEENISDVINACDLWLAFESTTVFESWILGKTTFYINPCGSDFNRSIIAKGAPKIGTYEELQRRIDQYLDTGTDCEFEELKRVREDLVKDIIGYSDGLSHKRAAEYIMQEFESNKKKRLCFDNNVVKTIIVAALKWIYISTPLKYIFYKRYKAFLSYSTRYNYKEREAITKVYREALNSAK